MLIRADARRIPLMDGCVQTCVTSPPYWGLRDYGHADQIGLEPTPEAYVAQLVAVFRDVRRVLRADGTVWLNCGDSYHNIRTHLNGGVPTNTVHRGGSRDGTENYNRENRNKSLPGLKEKDLVGIPWRVAFALQADGWYLRADIIWAKPNPMPESVTDRPTKAHEYLFLLAKSERYYYDAKAIQEPASGNAHSRGDGLNPKAKQNHWNSAQNTSFSAAINGIVEERNKRSVWTVTTQAYAGSHFATFPERLIEPCILAGAPIGGLVFDPFIGSGTVGAVASRLGRRWIGCDLRYHNLSAERTAQRGLAFA